MTFSHKSDRERSNNHRLMEIATTLIPQFGHDWNADSNVFLRRQTLSRILYLNSLYQRIVEIPGVVLEFGCRWGASLPVLMGLRGVYEPFNFTREIVGFDTFEGLYGVSDIDGSRVSEGAFDVSAGYEETLTKILELHATDSPLPDLMRAYVVKGDARETFPTWLSDNRHAVIAMAIFDMDIYLPTREVLQLVVPRLTKGSLLVFDELSTAAFPGETQAVDEVFGLNRLRLQRLPVAPTCAFAVYEG
jgi:hypothetical protein